FISTIIIPYSTIFPYTTLFRSFSQTHNDSIKNNDIKLAALPYYSYGKGLGITSADSLFQLNIRFRMQNRATYINEEGEDNRYERSEEHTSELQSRENLVCRLLL